MGLIEEKFPELKSIAKNCLNSGADEVKYLTLTHYYTSTHLTHIVENSRCAWLLQFILITASS